MARDGRNEFATLEFISASRSPPAAAAETRLALSLRRIVDGLTSARIEASNSIGLPQIYNKAIVSSSAEMLAFVHDDVWIDDFFIAQRLSEALARFDIVGVAGSGNCLAGHTTWAHGAVDAFSGALAHGDPATAQVTTFGPAPAACELLDGVFLAARRSRLLETGVRFDERFDFHHYDLDFCRTARAAGLSVGTWPISMTHASRGGFSSDAWHSSASVYLAKWA